jgi:hypothetical protein
MAVLSSLGHVGLAFRKDLGLPGDLSQPTDDLLVASVKVVNGVRDTDFLTELNHQLLGAAEIVSRDTGVEVVDSLRGLA